ncbi:MAG TPA: hypothetical protein VN132_14075 [Bdellovibrio sp.]|nr:hypothetical protein [Bdellovibrio sp.]
MKGLFFGFVFFASVFAQGQTQLPEASKWKIVQISNVKVVSTFFNPQPSSPFDVAAEAKFAITVIGSCRDAGETNIVDVSSIMKKKNEPSSVDETVYIATQQMRSGLGSGCEQTSILTVQRSLDATNVTSAKVTLMDGSTQAYRFTLRVQNNHLDVYDGAGNLIAAEE